MDNSVTAKYKIKVCGMRQYENIEAVSRLPIDYLGFIFYEKSKRFVDGVFDFKIINKIPVTIKKVGVFVNAPKEYVEEKIKEYSLDCIQLHGNETPDYCNYFGRKNVVIKAFGVSETFSFSTLDAYSDVCDFFLFDTQSVHHGGTGIKFDWNILRAYNNNKPIFLSGGIDVSDTELIKKLDLLNIHALDLNSKFEIEPALKNVDILSQFLAQLGQF